MFTKIIFSFMLLFSAAIAADIMHQDVLKHLKNYKLAPGYILVRTYLDPQEYHDKLFEAEVMMDGAVLSATDLDAVKCKQVWLRVPRGAVDGIVHTWYDAKDEAVKDKYISVLKKEYVVVCNEGSNH